MNTASVITIKGMKKCFGSKEVLKGLDLEVEPGKVLGLLGMNGAGKTTTMCLLLGLLKPDEGRMKVFGLCPWTMGRADRLRMGYLSEKDFPFETFSLKQAHGFLQRFYPDWDPQYFAQLAQLLKVPDNEAYRTLSRGQQRKFQLVTTLASKPELILLDDPGQGLDVGTRRDFITSLLPVLHEQKSTIIFSSHIMSDVERIADSVAILKQGRIVLHESLDILKEKVQQVIVSGTLSQQPSGTISTRSADHETCYTVLDLDPNELKRINPHAHPLEIRSLGLEDIFLEVVESNWRAS
jgi:ABC-2 type transport system ATP-binding protein